MSKSVNYLIRITNHQDPERRPKFLIQTLSRRHIKSRVESIRKQHPDSEIDCIKIDTKHNQMFRLWVEMTINSRNAGIRIAAITKALNADKHPLDIEDGESENEFCE